MKNRTMVKGIQVGANTHHHDQVITPVNFNAIKSSVRNVPKPAPELLDFAIAVALIIKKVYSCALSGTRTLDLMFKRHEL